MLARMLSLQARHCHPLLKLTPRELEVLFAAYARTVTPTFGRGLTSEELLDEQARRMYKALSRKSRKATEDVIQRYALQGSSDLVPWVQSREREATRLAALMCGDLEAALECLARSKGEPRESSLDLRDEATCDLLRFWVSESAMRARARTAGPVTAP